MPSEQLQAGANLQDTYQVVGLIGRGGMGEVYEVRHARLAGRYALKLLSAEAEKGGEAFLRFRREAEIASGLRHPHIVQVIDFDHTPDGRPYMVMELLEGDHLEALLRKVGPLPVPRVVAIVKQIASALTAAHARGVVHRDLKPENVILVGGGEGDFVKIVDFGVSKVKNATLRLTPGHRLIGTPHYMSPEQVHLAELDERTDQFALAAIAYELLCGETAFSGLDHAAVIYQVVHGQPPRLADPAGWISPAFDAVLKRALAKQPAERFPTIAEFGAALDSAAAALPSVPRSARPPAAATVRAPLEDTVLVSPPMSRNRRAVAALVALGVVAGGAVWLARRRPPPPAPTAVAPPVASPVPTAPAPPAPAPAGAGPLTPTVVPSARQTGERGEGGGRRAAPAAAETPAKASRRRSRQSTSHPERQLYNDL